MNTIDTLTEDDQQHLLRELLNSDSPKNLPEIHETVIKEGHEESDSSSAFSGDKKTPIRKDRDIDNLLDDPPSFSASSSNSGTKDILDISEQVAKMNELREKIKQLDLKKQESKKQNRKLVKTRSKLGKVLKRTITKEQVEAVTATLKIRTNFQLDKKLIKRQSTIIEDGDSDQLSRDDLSEESPTGFQLDHPSPGGKFTNFEIGPGR